MSVKTVANIGRTEIDGRAFLDYAKRYEISHAQLDRGVYRIPVEIGKHVLGVRVRIASVMTGAEGLKVGDGTDDDGYIVTGQIDPTTLNAVIDSRHLASEDVGGIATLNHYAIGGKFYAATGFVLITLAGTITAGSLVVEVLFDGYETAPKNMVANQ